MSAARLRDFEPVHQDGRLSRCKGTTRQPLWVPSKFHGVTLFTRFTEMMRQLRKDQQAENRPHDDRLSNMIVNACNLLLLKTAFFKNRAARAGQVSHEREDPQYPPRVSPTSPIRPGVSRFSPNKSLSGKERRGPLRKSAVVPTKSILRAANVPIIGGHHVLALQGSPEGWQATPLLECCREHADRPGASGAAARAVPGRDQ
jgi:hypothetical protein